VSAVDRMEPPIRVKRPRDTAQADHVTAGGEQVLDDVERDKAGGAGDQDGHVAEDSIRFGIRGCWFEPVCHVLPLRRTAVP
jgi:hypothetical protein